MFARCLQDLRELKVQVYNQTIIIKNITFIKTKKEVYLENASNSLIILSL